MDKIRIRRATAGDEAAIINLLGQVLYVHHVARPDLFLAKGSKYTAETITEIFKNDDRPIFVAVDETGKVLGHLFCMLEVHDEPNEVARKTLYIDDICIDENARGMHVGKIMYEFALDYAKKLGCYNVTLHVWEGNDNAKAFYEAMGMKAYMQAMETIL